MATNKIDIEEIFSLASEEEMLAFCKAYALSHTSFAEALQKRFAPKAQTVSMSLADLKKEIDRCYQHVVTAKKLILQCIQKYPSRPALRDEMQKALRKMK